MSEVVTRMTDIVRSIAIFFNFLDHCQGLLDGLKKLGCWSQKCPVERWGYVSEHVEFRVIQKRSDKEHAKRKELQECCLKAAVCISVGDANGWILMLRLMLILILKLMLTGLLLCVEAQEADIRRKGRESWDGEASQAKHNTISVKAVRTTPTAAGQQCQACLCPSTGR